MSKWETTVIKLMVLAAALALASSVQAMPLTSLQPPDGVVLTVREA